METVNGAILQAQSSDSSAFSIFHDQVQGKILNEVVGVVLQRLMSKTRKVNYLFFVD